MRMSAIIIGLLLVGGIITGLYSFVNGMADEDNYNVEFDDSYQGAFDKSQNISEKIADDYQKIQNFTANKGASIGIVTLIPDVLTLIKNTITLPLTLMEGMITSLIGYLQLPDWTFVLMMSILSVIVIFAFAALVLRYKYT